MAAPAKFSPGAGFEVPAKHRAVVVAFELENEGKSAYSADGFTCNARLVSNLRRIRRTCPKA